MTRLSCFAACACAAALAFALPAAAQTVPTLRAKVPFSFYASDRQIPAGECVVARANSRDVMSYVVYNLNASGGNIFYRPGAIGVVALAAFQIDTHKDAKPSLVFNKYGEDRYFLSQIVYGTHTPGVQLPKTRRERELITSTVRAQATPSRVVVVALAVR